ncbi:MAG: 5-formyltetrahydrofolate cyclo-ligase [Thermodesulfobacteriota bacterium]
MTTESRETLRQRILAARDALPEAVRQERSAAICARLWEIPAVAAGGTVMVYVSFRSEVETGPLIAEALRRGVTVAVPRTEVKAKRLAVYRLSDPGRELRPGYCGIMEPDPARAAPVEPAAIDVVILPGSVFDRHGGRLGYGGGYYDRFLALEAPRALRVAVAFDMQVVARVPVLAHDMRLHWLVTESGARATG